MRTLLELLWLSACFCAGAGFGMLLLERNNAPTIEQIDAEDETEVAEATRAECIPCSGEGNVCGKMCIHCNGAGTVPINRLTLYPEKDEGPDCTVKLHLLRK